MRAAATTLIVLALAAVVAYVALRGPNYATVHYVPHTSPATAAVSGRAVDSAGRPVADVELTWFSAQAAQGGVFGGTIFRGHDTGIRTAADGTFRLEGLRGDEGYVAVGSDVLREGETALVRLRAGFEASELELVVADVPLARRVQGSVVHADGSPAAAVQLIARGESWRGTWQQLRMTDASGGFEFVGMWAGGGCELTLIRDDGSKQLLGEFPMGTRGIVLRLP